MKFKCSRCGNDMFWIHEIFATYYDKEFPTPLEYKNKIASQGFRAYCNYCGIRPSWGPADNIEQLRECMLDAGVLYD